MSLLNDGGEGVEATMADPTMADPTITVLMPISGFKLPFNIRLETECDNKFNVGYALAAAIPTPPNDVLLVFQLKS